MKTNYICTVKGSMAFEAPDATCLDVRVGAYYVITKQADPAWWCGRLIENGLVSGMVGLLPSDHLVMVGQGLVLPGLEPLPPTRKSKKKSRKAYSSSTLPKRKTGESKPLSPEKVEETKQDVAANSPIAASEAAARATAQVFASTLADKQAELDLLARTLEKANKRNAKLKAEAAEAKKRELELRAQLDSIGSTCVRCGSVLGVDKDVAAASSEKNGEDGLNLLVSQGYSLNVLMRFKSVIRSVVMRRRFRKVAMDFKSHKASLVMRLRNESLREILTSEQKYVESLQLAVDEFQRPMVRLASSGRQTARIVQRSDVSDIFSTLEIIVELNRGLLTDLKDRLAQWPSVQRFGDLFLRMGPILRLYSGYIRNFDVAQRVLVEKRQNALFVEFLDECEKKAGQPLDSFLIMPIQRLPRYQMLMNGLLKYTDPMHIDYSDISLAHTRMIEICHEVNFQKSVDDNTREMRVLFDEVEGLVEALLPLSATSGSYFIHRGDLHSIMGATVDNYYCFLFSNCLIRAVPTKKKAPAWSVVDVVALHSIASVKEIPDMSGIANGFEIGVTRMKGEGFQLEKSDVLAMCAPSASEKSAWLAKLGNFLERWRGGEEGARVLLDATLKLLDEHSAPAPVPVGGQGGRSGLAQSGHTPQRLLSKGILRQSSLGRSSKDILSSK